jgi:hemerythrin
MTYLPWKDAYCIGFKQIDDGHKILLSFIDELFVAINKEMLWATISGSLGHLVEYTVYHFSAEMKLFDQYNYPKAVKHLEEHNYFVEKLKKMDYLKDWTISHILGADKEFSEYAKKHKH